MHRQSRFNILLKKKGISPLIATVLLISFTVGIVSLVMLWGKGFMTEKTAEETESAEARMGCINMKITVDKSCRVDDDTVSLTIRNLASESIDAFIFRSTEMGAVIERDEEMKAFATSTITLSETGIGTIEILDVVPQKKVGEEWLPCAAASKSVKIIPETDPMCA